jgi:phosphatidylglycerol---prolipoprotein diacylglyceryl transferase
VHPVLFSFGPVHVYAYGTFVALGVFFAILFLRKNAKKIFVSSESVVDLAIATVVSGFLGARFFYIVQFWDYFQKAPLDMFKLWEGGIIFYGGLIGGTLGFFIFIQLKRLPFLGLLDLFVIATALAQGFGRIGCFLNGCCFGSPSQAPWAVSFPFLDHAVHPTQLYESSFCFLLAFFLFLVLRQKPRTGIVSVAYFVLYPLGRFALEFFRGDNVKVFLNLTLQQWISAVFISVVLIAAFFYYGTKKIHRSS